jgi:hypothetical protein
MLSSVVMLLSLVAPQAFAQGLAAVVDPYLKVQVALAADSTTGVREAATAMVSGASALGKPGEAMATAARSLQQAGSLAAARDAFDDATTALLKYADSTKTPLGPGVRRTYCPMEKKTWAQKDGPIANPYAGKRMLRCGEFIDGKS